jgi:hypothetical protein
MSETDTITALKERVSSEMRRLNYSEATITSIGYSFGGISAGQTQLSAC